MRVFAISLATAAVLGLAAPIALAQDSGMKTDSKAGAKVEEKASSGKQGAGTSARGDVSTRTSVRTRSEGSRLSIRAGEDRGRFNERTRVRARIGVHARGGDDVVIKRKHTRFVGTYDEPSRIYIKKKKRHFVRYYNDEPTIYIKKKKKRHVVRYYDDEPSSVYIKRHRPRHHVAVGFEERRSVRRPGADISIRGSVRSKETVGVRSSNRTSVGVQTNTRTSVGTRASGKATIGAGNSNGSAPKGETSGKSSETGNQKQ